MPEPTGSEARLQALRKRWETEKSTAFLPLAEEYRRLGRLREAIDVLENGLKGNPTYTSGLVALGRCRLESGDPAGAAGVLERVVAQDPEQLVASKLLIEAYLRTGRSREARRRLDIYTTLNAKDPEIARLSDRLRSLAAPESPAAVEAPNVAAVAAAPERTAPPEAQTASASETATPIALTAPAAPEAESAEPWEAPAPPMPPLAEPVLFRGLDGPVAASRYLRGLVSEGVFKLMFPAAALRQTAISAASAAPLAVAAPVPPVAQAEPWSWRADEEAEPEAEEAAPAGPEPRTPPPAVEAGVELAAAAASEPALEPFEADVERAISGFVSTPPAASAGVAASAPAGAIEAAPVEPPPPTAAEARETATLAELYLQQGHAAASSAPCWGGTRATKMPGADWVKPRSACGRPAGFPRAAPTRCATTCGA
jgi:tetratricopeptide (TPR) repeat protein